MSAQRPKRIVAVGEILWDCIGKERHIGGAPFNFAFHASQFGHEACVISRVGRDPLGQEILESVRRMGISCEHIQVDTEHPTGTVKVSVNLFGEPTFKIEGDVAWDYIEATEAQHNLVRTADVLWFGTLAQRAATSRASIQALLETARNARREVLLVCDLNLRQPFYSPPIIRQSLEHCRVLRLNEDELAIVKKMFGRESASDRQFAVEIMQQFHILLVAVTQAGRGCTLHTPDAEVRHPGFLVDVANTVGAGRAFTAAMVTQLLEGAPLAEVARYANLTGAYVTTHPGAAPRFTPSGLGRFEMELERMQR